LRRVLPIRQGEGFMQHEIIIAGWGGQGVLTLGKLLARGAMDTGQQVTYFPSYGTEVRGGTANCHVKISDREIYSPLVDRPTTLVVMNQPSYERFRPDLVEDGWLVVNTTTTDPPEEDLERDHTVAVAATETASTLGNLVVANMVMLGALNELLELLPREVIERRLSEELTGAKAALIPINLKALEAGREAVRQRTAAS
jgi:2-oxoglutarate ferredoxin oxidoreductase subunit gamma